MSDQKPAQRGRIVPRRKPPTIWEDRNGWVDNRERALRASMEAAYDRMHSNDQSRSLYSDSSLGWMAPNARPDVRTVGGHPQTAPATLASQPGREHDSLIAAQQIGPEAPPMGADLAAGNLAAPWSPNSGRRDQPGDWAQDVGQYCPLPVVTGIEGEVREEYPGAVADWAKGRMEDELRRDAAAVRREAEAMAEYVAERIPTRMKEPDFWWSVCDALIDAALNRSKISRLARTLKKSMD